MRRRSPKKAHSPISERLENIHLLMPSIPQIEYRAVIYPAIKRIQFMKIGPNQRMEIEREVERCLHKINEVYAEQPANRNIKMLEEARKELIQLSIKYLQMKRRPP